MATPSDCAPSRISRCQRVLMRVSVVLLTAVFVRGLFSAASLDLLTRMQPLPPRASEATNSTAVQANP